MLLHRPELCITRYEKVLSVFQVEKEGAVGHGFVSSGQSEFGPLGGFWDLSVG
jgi:hypothetical protein